VIDVPPCLVDESILDRISDVLPEVYYALLPSLSSILGYFIEGISEIIDGITEDEFPEAVLVCEYKLLT